MVWQPPRINPNAYGDDYRLRQLPPRRPDERATMRQGMDYRESFLQQSSQNRSPSLGGAESAECCDCELEDDVFDQTPTPRRFSGGARKYEQKTSSTPHYPRARSYYSEGGPRSSSSSGSSSSGSSDWSLSSTDDELQSPAWEGSPRSGRIWSDEARKCKCGQGMYGRPPSVDFNEFEYNPRTPKSGGSSTSSSSAWSPSGSSDWSSYSSDDDPLPPPTRRGPRKRTLPSWPNTPPLIKDTTRKSPYLSPFDIHSPPWDFETRHTMPEKPSRKMSMPQVPGTASGQPHSGPTFSWTVTPDGRPSLALNYLHAQDNPTHIHGLTADTYNKFLRKQDLALVMFYNSGHISSGTLQDWAKRNLMKAVQLTGGSNQTFAAVDCAKETDLCATQQINTFPFFRLYSKGYLMKHITDFARLAKGK